MNMLIAEIGSVHDGSFGNAKKLIELAAICGADAVKFQTHIADAETIVNAPAPSYFKDEPRSDYFKRTSFNKEQWAELKQTADDAGIIFLSSPFSLEAVELLESIGMEVYKIPSGEVTNIPLLEKIAALGKPVFLSSGMSNWIELDEAVDIFRGQCDLTVMQCSSTYPCPPNQVGLNVIAEISQRYRCNVGFSDHTLGIAAPIAAAALGATIIEKHFTFSKYMYGSDAQHSMEPNEFRLLSAALREIWEIQANPVNKNSSESYSEMKDIFQKSIVAAVPIKRGTILEMKHLAFKKPGTGIPASSYRELVGKQMIRDCKPDEIIKMEWLA